MIRILLTILTIIFFITPVMAAEGTADGKGIYCATAPEKQCMGYWFEHGGSICYFIDDFEVQVEGKTMVYVEEGLSNLTLNDVMQNGAELDRRTLTLTFKGASTTHQCQLVNSPEELKQKLQDQIDAAKAENKL